MWGLAPIILYIHAHCLVHSDNIIIHFCIDVQATVFLKYLPNWTTWIVLVAISLYGMCNDLAILHTSLGVVACYGNCALRLILNY